MTLRRVIELCDGLSAAGRRCGCPTVWLSDGAAQEEFDTADFRLVTSPEMALG
jgi:hypothetical protein